MQWNRTDYLDYMTFTRVERPMFCELFGPLIGLEQEWREQGATDDEIALTAFDWDFVSIVTCGADTDPQRMPEEILSDTADELIKRDHLGRTVKLCKKTATIPLPQDFPVKTMDDWIKLKPRFVFDESRINWTQVDKARALQAEGRLVVAGIPGAFDMARELMGEEGACLAYYDQPELMADLLATLTDTCVQVYQRICDRLTIDQLSVHEDFAGKSGPLVGPAQIAEHFQPYYRKIWSIVQSHGGRIFQLDTDGNINSVIDALLACGLTSIHPMEPAAGMDIVSLRRTYGTRLMMAGGIDKFALLNDRAAIRRELEYKLHPSVWRQGGMVYGLDHRIPNGVPIDNYRYYVTLARDILGLPPLSPTRRGWGRMAF